MTQSSRREIVLALAALGLVPRAAEAAEAELGPGAKLLRDAYLAAHPQLTDTAGLAARLLPGGWSPGAEAKLRARVAADFRAGRLFVFRGWRLSDTEGQLFAALGG